ncbi:MAG TPA: ABC transporter substrate-binding protein [Salinisphaeraceae bacterium]|nr:ABC transporter substrate-binding protein [Salinisphaeraceae bacterium]
MKGIRLTKIALLALGLLLVMPATIAADDTDATMTIGIGITLDTLDPAQQTTTTVMNVLDYELQTLLTLDQDGQLQPQLAESWSWSEDGETLTLKLREGVKFHDGTPFDAEAVKFSLGRLISDDVKVPIGIAFQVIESIEAVDAHTVRLNLRNPQPNLLPNLAFTVAAMLSPASVDAEGNSYTNMTQPVGTGPYQLVRRQQGSQLVFERVDDYWGEPPYYSRVVFKIVPESNALEAGLLSGQLDLIMNPPVSDLQSLSQQDGITVLKAPSNRSIFVAFVTNKPPFDDKKVRQAINYAVDKEAIIKNVLFSAVDRMDSPFAALLPGYCEVGGYDYDPNKAKELLAEAGVESVSITMGAPRGRYTQDYQAAQAIASYLRKVDVDVKVETMDWASYISLIGSTENTLNSYMLGWAPPAMDAPTQLLMLTEEGWPPKGLNGTFYSDPEVEELFAKARRELDAAKRDEMYCEIQKKLWDDAPWLWLWSQNLILAYNSDIEGISYQPNEKFMTIYAHPK